MRGVGRDVGGETHWTETDTGGKTTEGKVKSLGDAKSNTMSFSERKK